MYGAGMGDENVRGHLKILPATVNNSIFVLSLTRTPQDITTTTPISSSPSPLLLICPHTHRVWLILCPQSEYNSLCLIGLSHVSIWFYPHASTVVHLGPYLLLASHSCWHLVSLSLDLYLQSRLHHVAKGIFKWKSDHLCSQLKIRGPVGMF